MKRRTVLTNLFLFTALFLLTFGDPVSATETPENLPRNIILMIGDGLGEVQRTAARWSSVGPDGQLAMDRLPFNGRVRTASADDPVTDSAAAATAMATGIKTNNGVIGMDTELQSLPTILELAKAQGKAVGLVTTTQISHATPAAFAAHVPNRKQMLTIAAQLVAAEVDVLLGGGEDEFLPASQTGCYPQPGERSDRRNLIKEAESEGWSYLCDAEMFAAFKPGVSSRVLGLFADEGMVRPYAPSLAAMTAKAIAILSRDPDGFFLLVEGGQIDWASHKNDAGKVIDDTLGFDRAVAEAQAFAARSAETLLIVTADHETGGMQLSLTPSGRPGEDGPFARPDGQVFYVQWQTGKHTAARVPVSAQGPGAERLNGVHDNTAIYRVMTNAQPAP
jgi:alkaline phosphatase